MMQASNGLRSWLPYRECKADAGVRLFCFAHAGGAASLFREWPHRLPAHVEVCAVQLPGREARLMEPPFTRMPVLVDQLIAVLDPLLDRPFAFFGYSLGAAVAVETARRIGQVRGVSPAHLWVCARRAPQLPPPLETIHQLPDSAFKNRIRAFGGTPEEALNEPELLELILPILRADCELNDTYMAEPGRELLRCPLHALGGTEDADVPADDLKAWKDVTTGPFSSRMFPGGHFFLKSNLPAILGEIGRTLLGA